MFRLTISHSMQNRYPYRHPTTMPCHLTRTSSTAPLPCICCGKDSSRWRRRSWPKRRQSLHSPNRRRVLRIGHSMSPQSVRNRCSSTLPTCTTSCMSCATTRTCFRRLNGPDRTERYWKRVGAISNSSWDGYSLSGSSWVAERGTVRRACSRPWSTLDASSAASKVDICGRSDSCAAPLPTSPTCSNRHIDTSSTTTGPGTRSRDPLPASSARCWAFRPIRRYTLRRRRGLLPCRRFSNLPAS